MKTKIYIAIVLVLICAMIFGGIYLNQKSIDTAYNYAITLIQNGSYEGALGELEKANPNILNRKDFKSDMKYGSLNKCYKNTLPLYAYALAQQEYNAEDRYMQTVNDYLALIPSDYSGELSEEIKTFKGNFKPQYDDFLEEEKRKAEELRIQIEKSNQEFLASLKTKIPYEGMSEKYIDSTIMGKHHKYKNEVVGGGMRWETTVQKYYWENIEGDTILYVDCEDGVVKDVIKYGVDYFWTSDGRPIYSAVNPYRHSKKKSSTKKSYDDPYDVNDYSSPEDFYDDNYDDFWDYEEAEDYYNSYHEDP